MRTTVAVLLVTGGLAGSLIAQTASERLIQARSAFDNLDFEEAARLYTLVLDITSGATEAERDTAQLYLGVAYEYAGQRANALSAFRAFVRDNPCATTPQEFGAGVTASFVEARGGVFAVGLCELMRQELTAGAGAVFRIAATRPAIVRVLLRDSGGETVADLGEQQAAGMSQVRWATAPDLTRFSVQPARYDLIIRARAQQGGETDERLVGVLVRATPVDTAPHPLPLPDSLFRPEQRPAGAALGDLAKGVGFGVAIAAASTALAYKSLKGESGKGLAVGAAVSVAGVIAFASGTARRDIVENRAYNQELSRRWAVQRDSVVSANRRRLLERTIVIEPVVEGR